MVLSSHFTMNERDPGEPNEESTGVPGGESSSEQEAREANVYNLEDNIETEYESFVDGLRRGEFITEAQAEEMKTTAAFILTSIPVDTLRDLFIANPETLPDVFQQMEKNSVGFPPDEQAHLIKFFTIIKNYKIAAGTADIPPESKSEAWQKEAKELLGDFLHANFDINLFQELLSFLSKTSFVFFP